MDTWSLSWLLTKKHQYQDIFDTPDQYNHKFGDIEVFKMSNTNKMHAFIKIPKCMSTVTKTAIEKSPYYIPIEWDNDFSVSDFNFFTIVRPEYQRMYSGINEWRSVDPSTYNNFSMPQEVINRLPTLAERQDYEFHDIIANTSIWDEHVEPQLSYLTPFITFNIHFRMFMLTNNINDQLNKYLGSEVFMDTWNESNRRPI
jgi:hypothetical protein